MTEIDWQTHRHRGRELVRVLVERPTDLASLAVFRVLFGLLMAGAMVRFLAKDWVRELYTGPKFHFTYPGFEWVRPWPEALMHAHFVLLALLALGVAAGFFYRVCTALFFLGFTYVELIDQSVYLNHYYLISLISGIMVFLPAHRAWSVDAWRKPAIRMDAVPAWGLNLLRFQIGVVYVFAGLAKLNSDWLLRAEPLRIWLSARSDLPMIGSMLSEPSVAYVASWFGAAFDLSIVAFLLWRPTRRTAYALLILFHVATWVFFNIGMFPWIMIVAATVFFPAGWPRHWLSRFTALLSRRLPSRAWASRMKDVVTARSPYRVLPCRKPFLLLVPLSVYAIVQIGLPLRPYFAAQPTGWTGSGFNCTWRVMLVEKTGYVKFFAFDPTTGKRWRLRTTDYLTPRQEVMMAQDPYLIRAMAQRLATDLRSAGHSSIQIQVDAYATLNGRPSQRLIDPDVDLTKTRGTQWIAALRPLEENIRGQSVTNCQ